MNLNAAIIRLLILSLPVIWIAQDVLAAPVAPPSPELRKSPAAWIGILLMVLLVVVILVISLWPSKRGHQD
ncbi:MAG: hypothetical protein P8J86_01920 [Phycisphaerales bacterium]|nr:hypothetical protein [Phycisphaerales bacterium]